MTTSRVYSSRVVGWTPIVIAPWGPWGSLTLCRPSNALITTLGVNHRRICLVCWVFLCCLLPCIIVFLRSGEEEERAKQKQLHGHLVVQVAQMNDKDCGCGKGMKMFLYNGTPGNDREGFLIIMWQAQAGAQLCNYYWNSLLCLCFLLRHLNLSSRPA